MALTLVEAAKVAGQNTKRGTIIEIFAQANDVLAALPFMDITGTGYDYNREATLPGIGFRGINEEYTASVGVINPMHDPLKVGGGTLDVDRALIKMMGPQVRTTHEAMKAKALSLKIARTIIKGDSQADAREFDGLQRRLTGDQKICNTSSTSASAGALSLAKLDQAIDAVDGATGLIMNKTMRRRLTAASRLSTVGGEITYTQDTWGRRVTRYADLPILISGKDNTDTEIIPDTETAGDAAADSTSIYVVAMGDGKLTGIQNGIMTVEDLGLTDGGILYRTLVEWLCGMALPHPRGASRLWNIDPTSAVVV